MIIPVDVSVLDKDKNPVSDLKHSDFTVLENGVAQDIRAFFTTKLEPQPPLAGESPTLIRTLEPPANMAPRTRRTFLFIFGSGRPDVPTKALEATIAFVREKLLPQDLVSVMAYNRVTDLTTDHEHVAQILERYQEGLPAINRAMADDIDSGSDVKPAIQTQIDAIFAPPGAQAAALRVRSATGLLLQSPELQEERLAMPGMNRYPIPPIPWNKRVIGGDLVKLFAGLEHLGTAPGEKHLVWFTDTGIYVPDKPALGKYWTKQDDERLAAVAARAHVAIDIVHTGGAKAGGLFTIAAGQHVAELTGGHFTGVNYASVPLQWVDNTTRYGYLIGYTPTNKAADDSFRTITVTVNRPGVTVLYRHGYRAGKDISPVDRRKQLVAHRFTAAIDLREAANDIVIRARASASTGPGRRVIVTATVDASRLAWTMQGGKHVATLDVQAIAGDAKEKVIGTEQRTLALSVDDETYQRYVTDGISYSARLTISDGDPVYVKVLAYDFGADLLGTAYVKLR